MIRLVDAGTLTDICTDLKYRRAILRHIDWENCHIYQTLFRKPLKKVTNV